MSERRDAKELRALSREVGEIWDRNAECWDRRMGEGNDHHNVLIRPAQERLLELRPGELVLDVACGNGQFARQMAQLGARVVAFDVSDRMIELARERTRDDIGEIEYSVLDATDEGGLAALGEGRFDAAVCTMAIMDMPVIEPLILALSRLLKPGCRFVFSVSHPCFNTEATTMLAEDVLREGRRVIEYSIRVSEYISPKTRRGEAMSGQPLLQYYFDRPISLLFKSCFDAGFVLDGLEEPVFSEAGAPGRLTWSNFSQIPPVLVARMRLPRR